jgi:hypothetical protein
VSLLTKIIFLVCFFCIRSESMDYDYDGYSEMSIPTISPNQLQEKIGKEKLTKILEYAPEWDFISDDIVLRYSIGYDVIQSRISTLLLENGDKKEIERLKELLSY